MTSTSIAVRPIRALALSLALTTVPVVAFAQTQPRPAPAQAPVKPKVTANSQPAAGAAPTAQVTQGPAVKVAGEDIVARVGGTNVSADELRAYVAALGPN